MAKKKIFIDADGNVIALYDEKFAQLADQLGKKEVHRASEVEFNNETQEWEVRCPLTNPVGMEPCKYYVGFPWRIVATGKTREEALAKEKEFVEGKFKEMIQYGFKVQIPGDSRCASRVEAVQPT